MTHVTRWMRPAAGFLAAGLLLPLLFSPPPTRLSDPALTETVTEPTISDATPPTQASSEPSPTPSPTVGLTDTLLPTDTDLPSPDTPTIGPTADTPEPTPSLSPTETPTDTPTATTAPTQGPSPFNPMTLLINEVAWSGTAASSNDEWIELQNPGPEPISLDGWLLTDSGDIHIRLRGTLPGYGFFLLERTDDTTVQDLPADQIYTGALSNTGERLELLDPSGALIDSANADGGGWPAGDVAQHASMERLSGPDGPGAWRSFTGCWSTGLDADGHPLNGTPRHPNSGLCPTPTAPTPTFTPSPTPPREPVAPLAVWINEVAWSGTTADASDEWIELHNPGPEALEVDGWLLIDGNDVRIALKGTILPYGFYLLERTNDRTVSDIPADQIYSGGLNNSGETLWLLGPQGEVIDSANADGGSWSAGCDSPRRSMERRGGDDRPGNWATFPGFGGVGHDAKGNAIGGTPRQPNAILLPRPTATAIPSRVVINEVLIRPHYDWEGTGGVTTGDEFIELYNAGDLPVHLLGWMLDDIEGAGSAPYTLQDTVLPAHGFLAFFRTRTKIALNDSGDTVRLLAPDGAVVDEITYLKVRAKNLSYGRLPDGSRHLHYGLWPTAGAPNLLYVEPRRPLPIRDDFVCPAGHLHPLLFRFHGHPLAQLHASTALTTCP